MGFKKLLTYIWLFWKNLANIFDADLRKNNYKENDTLYLQKYARWNHIFMKIGMLLQFFDAEKNNLKKIYNY